MAKKLVFDLDGVIISQQKKPVLHPEAKAVLENARKNLDEIILWSRAEFEYTYPDFDKFGLMPFFDRIIFGKEEYTPKISNSLSTLVPKGRLSSSEYIKDLSLLGGDPSDYVLIDNEPGQIYPPDRVVRVETYKGQKNHSLWEPYQYALKKFKGYNLDSDLRDFIPKISKEFDLWSKKKGFNDVYYFSTAKAINMAHNLTKNYDVGVGIARGGLYLAYISELFGLDVKIIDANRTGKGVFGVKTEWKDQITANNLKDKKIIVFDKDVLTGNTSRAVGSELLSYYPKVLDIALLHNLEDERSNHLQKPGNFSSNVPQFYDNVFDPKSFQFTLFNYAVKILEEKI